MILWHVKRMWNWDLSVDTSLCCSTGTHVHLHNAHDKFPTKTAEMSSCPRCRLPAKLKIFTAWPSWEKVCWAGDMKLSKLPFCSYFSPLALRFLWRRLHVPRWRFRSLLGTWPAGGCCALRLGERHQAGWVCHGHPTAPPLPPKANWANKVLSTLLLS